LNHKIYFLFVNYQLYSAENWKLSGPERFLVIVKQPDEEGTYMSVSEYGKVGINECSDQRYSHFAQKQTRREGIEGRAFRECAENCQGSIRT
jgi:hypothetical protein